MTACRVIVEGRRCRYEQMEGSNRYCRWHRLLRTSMDAQIRDAERRLALASPDSHRTRVSAAEWPDGERWCAGCQSFVPLFYCTGSRCKPCAAKAAREGRRMAVYGLTPTQYNELSELQGGRCAICRNRQTMRAIAVDHSHKTGDVRGLLCKRCNHDLLGASFESVRILLAAAVYLIAPPTSGAWVDPEDGGDAILNAFRAAVEEQARSVLR